MTMLAEHFEKHLQPSILTESTKWDAYSFGQAVSGNSRYAYQIKKERFTN